MLDLQITYRGVVYPMRVDAVERMIDDVGPPRDWSRRVVFLRWLVRKSGGNRRQK